MVFNVLIINDDNDSLKKIWAHTIGDELQIITIIYYIYIYIYINIYINFVFMFFACVRGYLFFAVIVIIWHFLPVNH